ncbi:066R [Cherax quadricarinatus iridovirus]|uniref:Uncharacterized protein n=1 Tax=Shrimp hemocyte iridescent virus TaxID=2039780 RepID=A0A291B0T4_9VIRU|nr:066R [Cherax quadricarinatus iridovirus]YP_010084837.1 hypothetical protein KM509_gp085 [Shrimp hemocyte iridescent virus]UPA43384.1 hypothetical protein 4TH000110 [Iridovirus CN01]ASZ85046.1 066R [Cherax quadricarinatus iridovirus]ATE87094.1 hypothetical protein [Shrimp hemocyte iridescent virus]UPA43460.1 hypothetical protein 3TG000027 [Iridovirus CN01]UPA43654.1 hypothetical protein 1DG000062 [Iridovirus CN01]
MAAGGWAYNELSGYRSEDFEDEDAEPQPDLGYRVGKYPFGKPKKSTFRDAYGNNPFFPEPKPIDNSPSYSLDEYQDDPNINWNNPDIPPRICYKATYAELFECNEEPYIPNPELERIAEDEMRRGCMRIEDRNIENEARFLVPHNGYEIGPRVEDNGPRWGSFVGREKDGSFPFDEEMKKNRPEDWQKMIQERVAFLLPQNRVYDLSPRRYPKKKKGNKK